MKKLYIGEFNDAFTPLMDGVGNVTKNYTEELIKLNHEVTAIVGSTIDGEEFDKKNNINYTIRCLTKPVKGLEPYGITKISKENKEKIQKLKFDIIHTHCPFYTGKFALKEAKKRNIPIITTFHTQYGDDIKNYVKIGWFAKLVTKIVTRYYNKCDEVWVPSKKTKEVLKDKYHFKGEIRIVENGCDMKKRGKEEIENLKKIGLSLCKSDNNTPILLYIGQHKIEKNLNLILNSLVFLKDKNVNFKTVFVGTGIYAPQMKKFCQENSLNDKVIFLGKICDREKIAALYSCASLFLFPSFYDTSCLVMREAAAFSVPLLFVEKSCTSELIADNHNGFIAPNNAISYGSKIKEIIEDKNLLNKVGKIAEKELYKSWDQVAKEVENLYVNAIKNYKSK